ncbi:MAG: DUF1444 family protein, partial [Thermoanaerobaculia bacterium]
EGVSSSRAGVGSLMVMLLLSLQVSCAPDRLTRGQFTRAVEASLIRALPAAKVEVKADLQIRIADATGKSINGFLDNAYDEYHEAPDRLPEIVERYCASMQESMAPETPIDRAQIVPILKDHAWMEEALLGVQERGATGPVEYVFEEYNEQLTILYGEDRPKNIRYLTPKALADLGIERSELRSLAVTNLRRMLPEIEVNQGTMISMITAGGTYEASLLLFDHIWKDGAMQVAGDPVVAIPARDLLLVTGTEIPGGVARLRELATRSVAVGSYHLTDELFVYREGRFTLLAAP